MVVPNGRYQHRHDRRRRPHPCSHAEAEELNRNENPGPFHSEGAGVFCKSSLENSMFRVKAAPFTKMIVFFHKLTFTLEFW